MDGEVVRLSISTGTDVDVRKTVLEVRPAPEHVVNEVALAEWVRTSLGMVARIAGYRAGEVTHVRFWREGRMVEVAVADLAEDLSGAETGRDGGSGGIVRVRSERASGRELGWFSGGLDGGEDRDG